MADIFKFKQFDVDQSNCAMKINTDGVLLGALASADGPARILDIGTGTGVIALMLAQRFADAAIEAVEIDEPAAETANLNFKNSPFANRLNLFATGFETFFESYPEKRYDLIVSNPPFFLNSLTSPAAKKSLAKHTDEAFFERLLSAIALHLTQYGVSLMVLPLETSALVKGMLGKVGLFLRATIAIRSFEGSVPHREIITVGRVDSLIEEMELIIYAEPKVYHEVYQQTLKEFLTIF